MKIRYTKARIRTDNVVLHRRLPYIGSRQKRFLCKVRFRFSSIPRRKAAANTFQTTFPQVCRTGRSRRTTALRTPHRSIDRRGTYSERRSRCPQKAVRRESRRKERRQSSFSATAAPKQDAVGRWADAYLPCPHPRSRQGL